MAEWYQSLVLVAGLIIASHRMGLTLREIRNTAACDVAGCLAILLYSHFNGVPINVSPGVATSYLFFGYALSSVVLYKNRLLPKTNEGVLLLLTISFYYRMAITESQTVQRFALLSLPVGGIALLSALTTIHLGKFLRVFLFGWYSFILILLGGAQIFVCFERFSSPVLVHWYEWALMTLECLWLSGSILVTLVMFVHFMMLWPSKGESWDSYTRRFKSLTDAFSHSFSSVQFPPSHAFALLVVYGGMVMVNYYFKILPPVLVISFATGPGLFWVSKHYEKIPKVRPTFPKKAA